MSQAVCSLIVLQQLDAQGASTVDSTLLDIDFTPLDHSIWMIFNERHVIILALHMHGAHAIVTGECMCSRSRRQAPLHHDDPCSNEKLPALVSHKIPVA